MAEESSSGGVPTAVWILIALVVVYLLFRQTQASISAAAAKAANPTNAKALGQGIGQGAVGELGSAIGNFAKAFGGGSSSSSSSSPTTTKSSGDSGGPVTRSSGIDWDTDPPDDAVADDLEGPSFV